MSIRDIIEAAVENADDVLGDRSYFIGSSDLCYGFDEVNWERQEKFIATFDPEHVALMEAVIEGVTLTTTPNTGNAVAIIEPKALHAMQVLTAYRKERGL